jgi:iron complex outermembrane recepter protein
MKLETIVQALVLAGLAGQALAQTAPQRIEITGSSIKRLADEGALPIQVITAEDIAQQGITSVEELLGGLTASAAHVDNATSRNNVFGADQDRLTGGASFANLRGLGPTGTLVLLNGRRVSTHGMSGGAVDLSAIPIAAVARVEVLKDGASAIYGTDAIGGVINFILKREYNGVQLAASLTDPLATGGGQTRRVSLTWGSGDLANKGYSLMASVTLDQNEILRGIDRDWASGYRPDLGLTPDTTSSPHANIINSAGTALPTTGTVVGATDPVRYTNLNLLAIQGQCDQQPFGAAKAPNITLWDKFGYTNANSRYRCVTDYGRQFMLTAPREGVNVLLRGAFKLGKHIATLDYIGSRSTSQAEFTPYQFSTTSNAVTHYPVNGPYYLNMRNLVGATQFDPTRPIAYRMRMWDWGYRTIENTSDNRRFSAALEGELSQTWSYKTGISWGEAKASSLMLDGYADTNRLIAALATGIINPFLMPGQSQTPEAMALIESTKVRGRLFGGEARVVQFDGAVSGPVFDLPAGSVDAAVGFDVRQEFYGFSGSQFFTCVATFTVPNAALPNSVMGCPGNSASPNRERDIKAVYAELLVPVFKSLQLTFQARHDRYGDFGSTTNPKVAFRFQPHRDFLMRGSWNTGFRAPTVQQLALGSVELALTGTFNDPIRCPVDPTQCQRQSLPYRQGGNPDLKPETSKQHSLGIAFSPLRNAQVFADYWQVRLDDRIRNLTPTFLITNFDLFRDSFVRDVNGNVQYIQAGWVNAAESITKGLDFGARYSHAGFGGRLSYSMDATKMLSYKERLIPTLPLQEFVGKWSTGTLFLDWRVSGSVSFRKGPWNTTFSARWSSGYEDEDRTPYTANPPVLRKIEPYYTANLFTTYTGVKNLTVTAGVINLFDKDPPFTWHNVDQVVGAGWDPRVADPRGRTAQVSMRYEWK